MRTVRNRRGEGVLRAGWVAKGVLYCVVGVLALQVALQGGSQEQPDQQGALRALRDQPFGAVLLAVLAVGLALYAVWRFVDAAMGEDDGWATRAGHAVSGLVHLALAVLAGRVVLDGSEGSGSGSGGGNEASTLSARVMEASGGRLVVGAVGLVLAGVGVKFLVEGVRRTFLDELELRRTGAERRWLEPLGVAGNVARGVVFLLIGWFVVQAAVQYDATEARGLDGALLTLAGQPYGTFLLVVVALGLIAYGLFAALSARSRKPPA
jgi:hypothetical protein